MDHQTGSLLIHAATVFMGFFAIMNPIANTSIFIGLTTGDDVATKKTVARNALLMTFVIIAIVAVLGKLIFELFGITLPAFRITGGILIFLIGVQMLQGSQSSVHKPSDSDLQKSRLAAGHPHTCRPGYDRRRNELCLWEWHGSNCRHDSSVCGAVFDHVLLFSIR
ncbi:MarC family integral membrane protein [Olavius algarvensis associated proteobacterium Delta 3]|nr:MarC family integral membrane protein [Olavius algarvensis associated proteobacterium Delta 3]